MKATKAGKIIGYAIEEFPLTDAGGPRKDRDVMLKEDEILMFVSSSYWIPIEQNTDDTDGNTDDTDASSRPEGWLAEAIDAVIEFVKDAVLRVREVVADVLRSRKVVTDALELKDAVTGEIYCVRIAEGEWQKFKGTCGDTSSSTNNESGNEFTNENSDANNTNSEGDPTSQDSVIPAEAGNQAEVGSPNIEAPEPLNDLPSESSSGDPTSPELETSASPEVGSPNIDAPLNDSPSESSAAGE